MSKPTAIISFLSFLLAFAVPAECREAPGRGLFVSVIQDPPVLSSRQDIMTLVDFAKEAKVQVLFVQVYRANQAWFPSQVADPAPYEACLKSVGKDPLALLIKEAHASGIQVHAWLNLMSLSANVEAPLLKKYGPEILTRNLREKKTLEDYKIDNQYFLEPGDLRVREALSEIVGEIARAYPALDGLQFDYIRYPDLHPQYGYTQMNIARFKEATGLQTITEDSPAWKNWKRSQVTDLLKELIREARSIHPDIQVSTTGLMPYSRAYLEAYQDWKTWLEAGLVDFVTLMCYSKSSQDFKRYVANARKKVGSLDKVNLAIGAYELVHWPRTFQKEFGICEESNARACVVLHYGSLLEDRALMRPLTGKNR